MAKLKHLKACNVSDDGHTDNLSNKEQMLIQLQHWKHAHMWDQLLFTGSLSLFLRPTCE